VFHPGAQNSWQRALAAQEAGVLAWYLSSLHVRHGGPAQRLAAGLPGVLGRGVRGELARRCCPALDPERVRRAGASELLEVGLRRGGRMRAAAAVNRWGNARFARHAIACARAEPVELIWTHNDCAAETFAWARERGVRCVLDQSIGHPAALAEILAADRARYPDLHAGGPPPPGPREIARADRELELADVVLVGSAFARETLVARGVPAAKIRLLPYGFDETLWPAPAAPSPRPPRAGRPLAVLFAGAVQPRKGVGALLEAFAGIDPRAARLTLLGRMDLPAGTRLPAGVVHRPPVPRAGVAAAMVAADVLILPSLLEGSAVVAYEAQAAGLALIQSANTGLLARPGETGLILPEVSAPAIRRAVLTLAEDPGLLAGMQAAAAAARPRSWADYRADARRVLGLDGALQAPAAAERAAEMEAETAAETATETATETGA
jgi:glycosyltransferase involved in cell wall biosynthesis